MADHESRRSSYNAEDDIQSASEDTPLLLHRFSRGTENSTLATVMVVGMMVVILLSGFAIGVYLLILQSNSDNMLPPVTMPIKYMARSQWDNDGYQSPVNPSTFNADCLIVEQTNTRECTERQSCLKLLNEIKDNDYKMELPYNFLISSDGYIYEYLGWRSSALYTGVSGLVIGFIGDFSDITPTHEQIEAVKNLVYLSVSKNYLDSDFTVVSNSKTEIVLRYINNIFVESIPIE